MGNNKIYSTPEMMERYRQEIIEAMAYDQNQGMYITQISLKCPGHKNSIFKLIEEMVDNGEIIKTDEVRRGRGQAKSIYKLVTEVKRDYFAGRRAQRAVKAVPNI